MNMLQVPTDPETLARRKAIKDNTTPFRRRNKPSVVDDLPFAVDLDRRENRKLHGENK